MDINFDVLTEKYLPEITNLFINAFNAAPWNDKWTKESAYKRLSQTMNFPDSFGLVAFENNESKNKIAGFILGHKEYYCETEEFVIKEFCVDKNIKGKGIGTKILQELENHLTSKGIKEITLMTLNSPATEKFYEKCGYETMENLIMMNKNL